MTTTEQLLIKPDFLPLSQVTAIYGLSTSYLYKLRYDRKLFHYALGDRTFIRVSELESLIAGGKKSNN